MSGHSKRSSKSKNSCRHGHQHSPEKQEADKTNTVSPQNGIEQTESTRAWAVALAMEEPAARPASKESERQRSPEVLKQPAGWRLRGDECTPMEMLALRGEAERLRDMEKSMEKIQREMAERERERDEARTVAEKHEKERDAAVAALEALRSQREVDTSADSTGSDRVAELGRELANVKAEAAKNKEELDRLFDRSVMLEGVLNTKENEEAAIQLLMNDMKERLTELNVTVAKEKALRMKAEKELQLLKDSICARELMDKEQGREGANAVSMLYHSCEEGDDLAGREGARRDAEGVGRRAEAGSSNHINHDDTNFAQQLYQEELELQQTEKVLREEAEEQSRLLALSLQEEEKRARERAASPAPNDWGYHV